MKSRHTPMKGKLTRSFGLRGNEDMVVELSADGHVSFRREPCDRKLKRGEELPELRLDVEETCQTLGSRSEADAIELIEAVASRVPIAVFEGVKPEHVAYSMKCWLMKELKQEIENQKEQR